MMQFIQRMICAIGISAPLLLTGQTGCPGCLVNLPAGLPVDTVYLPSVPDGQVGVAYNQDISFRMPKTTTPVAAIDSTTPPGITISSIEIVSVDGIPPGLSWEASQTVFPVATQTDGCIKICGTPAVSDSFVVTVRLKASIFFISQIAEFPMRIYIAPGVTTNAGFSMTNPTGCGSTEVTFANNIPSNGQTGFTYTWDFGDSTTYEGENPPAHVYNAPGTYTVNYTATIDTTGYILQSITLLDVDCSDNLGLGAPDIYLNILDSTGTQIYNNGNTPVNNITLPATIPVNLPLQAGNYIMQVLDEDGGIQGGDDLCGQFSFNVLSNGTVVSTGFEGVLNIIRPITTVSYTDTVVVYPLPDYPQATAPEGTVICSNVAPLILFSSYAQNNQWLFNGEPISGATDSVYLAGETGLYQVVYTSADGCTALSNSLEVEIISQPALPLFFNDQNLLTLFDTLALPDAYALQWYLNGLELPSNGFWHCATESGLYALEVVDTLTGCNNRYELNVQFNPNADCTSGLDETAFMGVKIYPNPANEVLMLDLGTTESVVSIQIFDATGRHIAQSTTVQQRNVIHCSEWANGLYYLTIIHEKGVFTRDFVIAR